MMNILLENFPHDIHNHISNYITEAFTETPENVSRVFTKNKRSPHIFSAQNGHKRHFAFFFLTPPPRL